MINCSSLSQSREERLQRIQSFNNKNECELIENPEELQEYSPDYNEGIGPSIFELYLLAVFHNDRRMHPKPGINILIPLSKRKVLKMITERI